MSNSQPGASRPNRVGTHYWTAGIMSNIIEVAAGRNQYPPYLEEIVPSRDYNGNIMLPDRIALGFNRSRITRTASQRVRDWTMQYAPNWPTLGVAAIGPNQPTFPPPGIVTGGAAVPSGPAPPAFPSLPALPGPSMLDVFGPPRSAPSAPFPSNAQMGGIPSVGLATAGTFRQQRATFPSPSNAAPNFSTNAPGNTLSLSGNTNLGPSVPGFSNRGTFSTGSQTQYGNNNAFASSAPQRPQDQQMGSSSASSAYPSSSATAPRRQPNQQMGSFSIFSANVPISATASQIQQNQHMGSFSAADAYPPSFVTARRRGGMSQGPPPPVPDYQNYSGSSGISEQQTGTYQQMTTLPPRSVPDDRNSFRPSGLGNQNMPLEFEQTHRATPTLSALYAGGSSIQEDVASLRLNSPLGSPLFQPPPPVGDPSQDMFLGENQMAFENPFESTFQPSTYEESIRRYSGTNYEFTALSEQFYDNDLASMLPEAPSQTPSNQSQPLLDPNLDPDFGPGGYSEWLEEDYSPALQTPNYAGYSEPASPTRSDEQDSSEEEKLPSGDSDTALAENGRR